MCVVFALLAADRQCLSLVRWMFTTGHPVTTHLMDPFAADLPGLSFGFSFGGKSHEARVIL